MGEIIALFIVRRDFVFGASPAEVVWLGLNVLGAILSVLAALLAAGDRRRVSIRRIVRRDVALARLARERGGIAVLGNVAARNEVLKASIHVGNGVAGVVVSAVPEPLRPQTTAILAFLALWFIVGSAILLVSTIFTLKARYDYRAMRQAGRCASWVEAARLLTREVQQEVSLMARALLGKRKL